MAPSAPIPPLYAYAPLPAFRPQTEASSSAKGTAIILPWHLPPIGEQMALPGSRTNPDLIAARFLLKPGRKYEDAVKAFQPYDSTKEINDDARKAGASLIEEGKQNPRRKTFIYINNRLEGNALETINAMLQQSSTLDHE